MFRRLIISHIDKMLNGREKIADGYSLKPI